MERVSWSITRRQVNLSKVIKDDTRAIMLGGSQDDGRGGIRLAGDPGAVEGIGGQ